MILYIRNMVCNRCKSVVRAELEKLGLLLKSVELGEVEIEQDELSPGQIKAVSESLASAGFELIDDKRTRVIEKMKKLIIELVHYDEERPKIKTSEYISSKMLMDYSTLSKLFSEVEGTTIEQYLIRQKIEKVKELLVYDELSLSEIAYQMGYSSVAHLSSQFKKITGLTPSFYKDKGIIKRIPLDQV
jgi:AraC-like DNA-binding protein